RPLGVAADKQGLGEARLVEEGGPLAAGAVLARDGVEPARPAEGVAVLRNLAAPGIGEPVRPLEAELLAEDGALRLQPLIERRAAERPAGTVLLEGPGDRIVLRIGFEGASGDP